MNYKLTTTTENEEQKGLLGSAFKKMLPLMADEKKNIIVAFFAIFINSGLTLSGPLILGYAVDHYVQTKQFTGVLLFAGLLLLVYLLAFGANYIQMKTMGGVGQRVLYKLRNLVFTKLQELPVAFFNQNKAGDLISRINNDTDKLNQFFSQSLMQFAGNFFVILGAAIFMLAVNVRLGFVTLLPAMALLVFTQLITSWVKRKNLESLQAEGKMSAEIQESLDNFRVIIAFNRRDYFQEKFKKANQENFHSSVWAGLANGIFSPLYDFAGNVAQLIILSYGIYLVVHGNLAIGLLIGFFLYSSRFYDPLRQVASLWSSLQIALAAWERVSEILSLESDLKVIVHERKEGVASRNKLMEFRNVHFRYPEGKEVLHNINFSLEKGKTYAFVGPTGGGKTTTASLLARLYDPTDGTILLDGKDIRSYSPEERTKKIGFILQEPFLVTGSVRDNIVYGNAEYVAFTDKDLENVFKEKHLENLLARFEHGLETKVSGNADSISLGQRQIIAFMRAILRNPELLILDEATANIDTITEQQLEEILRNLPKETTKVIIAHRLNTIENADEIFFVNSGEIKEAGSMEHAVDMLLHGKRQS